MEHKERFDALMKLAEFKCNVREKRRELEWKMSIGVWTVTVGAIAFLRNASIWLCAGFVVSLAILHGLAWVGVNFQTNERDARLMYFFADRAQQIILPDTIGEDLIYPGIAKPRFWRFLRHAPIWFEFSTTVLLGIGAALLSRQTPEERRPSAARAAACSRDSQN
jgi:hypothetical protein